MDGSHIFILIVPSKVKKSKCLLFLDIIHSQMQYRHRMYIVRILTSWSLLDVQLALMSAKVFCASKNCSSVLHGLTACEAAFVSSTDVVPFVSWHSLITNISTSSTCNCVWSETYCVVCMHLHAESF